MTGSVFEGSHGPAAVLNELGTPVNGVAWSSFDRAQDERVTSFTAAGLNSDGLTLLSTTPPFKRPGVASQHFLDDFYIRMKFLHEETSSLDNFKSKMLQEEEGRLFFGGRFFFLF